MTSWGQSSRVADLQRAGEQDTAFSGGRSPRYAHSIQDGGGGYINDSTDYAAGGIRDA